MRSKTRQLLEKWLKLQKPSVENDIKEVEFLYDWSTCKLDRRIMIAVLFIKAKT